MSLFLGDTVTKTCQPIKVGTVLRLFSTHATNILMPIPPPPSTIESRLTSASEKDNYIDIMRAGFLHVCDKPNFAKKHFLRRIQVKLKTKCPWFDHAATLYAAHVIYNEATTPFNGIDSAPVDTIETWPEETVNIRTYTTESINAPWAEDYESDGTCEVTIQVEQIDHDPTNPASPTTIRVTTTLVRFGRDYDTLQTPGPTVVQEVGCEFWNNGGTVAGFFEGVAFPIGPVGIVMSVSYSVTGGQGFVG